MRRVTFAEAQPLKCHHDTFLRRNGCCTLQLVNHGIFPTDEHAPALGSHCTTILALHLSNMFVGMMFSGVVLTKWSLPSGDMTLRAFNFNKLSISLNLDASIFFLVRIRQLIRHHTTLVFGSRRYPKSSCLVIKHRHSSIASMSSSFVRSRRRHSRARLPALSNQTWFQLEALSGSCWRISKDTERGSKRLHQAIVHMSSVLVSGQHFHEACVVD